MAESIKKSDIIENDILKSVIIEFEQAQVKIKAFNDELRQTAKLSKEGLNNVKLNSVNDINQAKIAILEANNAIKQKVLLQKADADITTYLEQTKTKLAKAESDYNKIKERSDTLTQKQTRSEQMLNSAYARVNSWLGKLQKEYRDLAIKKELNGKLTDDEIRRMTNIEGRMQAYDKALKKVDESMGLHRRKVGDYAGAFNGLGNSVNQLTREMPAFANSVGTGFMAISNNLPIFFDEITKIKNANAELIKQGQPVKSVFSQLGASIFSVGTLLSVGVTLLTVYGSKIVEWVENLGGANDKLEKQRKIREQINKEYKDGIEYVGKESAEYVGLIQTLKRTNENSQERRDLIVKINDEYGTTLKNISDEKLFQDQLNQSIKDFIEYKKQEFQIKVNEEKIARNLQYQLKLEKEIKDTQNAKFQAQIKYDLQKKALEGEDINDLLLRDQTGLTKTTNKLIEQQKQLEILNKHLEDYGLKIATATDEKGSLGFDNEKTKTVKKQEEYKNKTLKGTKLINNEVEKYDWDSLQKRLEQNLEYHKEKAFIDIEYEGEKNQLLIYSTKHTNEEIQKLEKENQLAILQAKIDFLKRNNYHEEALKLEIEYQKLLNNEIKKEQSTFAKDFNQVVKLSADYFIEQSNRKIAQIEKEQQQHEKAYSLYSDLAKNGNIQAKESLALENQQIVEANKKKQAELKKQAMWKLIEGGVSAYAKNAGDSSVKNPVMKTFSDITLLTQLLKTLPSFEVGTEDTGKNGNGIDGRGGFHAILHPNERVLTKEQNKLIGNVSNEDLALTMNKINSGELVKLKEGATSNVGNWQNMALISEIQDLKNIIKNKPDFKIEAGEIIQGAMSIVETKTTKNSIYSNRYIVK